MPATSTATDWPDEAVMKLVCAGGKLTSASYVVSPRESASGMATGRRHVQPVTIVKEWGAASPQLMQDEAAIRHQDAER